MNSNWNVSVRLTHTTQHNNTKSQFLSLPHLASICACTVRMLLLYHIEISWPVTYSVRALFILIWYNLIHYNPLCTWAGARVSKPSIRNNSKTQATATELYLSPRNSMRNKTIPHRISHNNVCADWLICTVLPFEHLVGRYALCCVVYTTP